MSVSHGQVASLTIVRGPEEGRRVEWDGSRFVIGRKRGDLLLSDREVSGLHAAIELSEGHWLLKDLGSTNGTFLEGRKVDGAAALAPGSHLKVGATYLRFELGDAVAPAEPEASHELEADVIAGSSGGSDDPLGELGLGGSRPPEPVDSGPFDAGPLEDLDLPEPQAPAASSSDPTRVPTAAPAEPVAPTPSAPPRVPTAAPAEPAPPARHAPTIPPAGRHAPTSPGASPAPPPRVGVTSHGDARQASTPPTPRPTTVPSAPETGSAWEALALPEGDAPIPPSPGAAARLEPTPLPGELRSASADSPSPPEPGPAPVRPAGAPSSRGTPMPPPESEPVEEEVPLPSSIERSPHGLYLIVEAGRDRGRVFPIQRETTILGRSDIDVRIDDPDVSRKHVALELRAKGPHVLKDLGSTNGTLLNGVKVTENPISANDIVRLGSTRVKLVEGERAVREELAVLARS